MHTERINIKILVIVITFDQNHPSYLNVRALISDQNVANLPEVLKKL